MPSAAESFYRRLLDLGGQAELEPLLDDALALIAEVTGASTAYLELSHYDDTEPRFWRAHHCTTDEVAAIRATNSRGIVGRAIADGSTIETPSAHTDPRFEDLASVRAHAIDAVLCTPVGVPSVGVIYLAGDRFSSADRERVELFARQLAPIADRLIARWQGRVRVDHTKVFRRRFRCEAIVGRSAPLAHLLTEASHVAPLDISVLITGPTGTGKSLLAKVIADNSKRAQRPFVAINCGAIPEQLVESELFGAEKGAHSTANQRVRGKVAAAAGGTLFLDEVADLPLAAQAKLLQLLQERHYYPLGGSASIPADVRVISATHQDLKSRVAKHQFREDLFYRLHVLPLGMPSLAERRDDISELVKHFCADACRRHDLKPLGITRRALHACEEAPWPGNLRELANAIEAAVVRAQIDGAETLGERHIFPSASKSTDEPLTLHEATREFRRRYLRETLERFDWNVTESAQHLDLARGHLYSLINDLGLRRG